jgi:hypothetical protein
MPGRRRLHLSRTEHRFASWRQGSHTSARSCAASGRGFGVPPPLSARQLKSLAGTPGSSRLRALAPGAATAAGGPGVQGRVERVGGDSSGGGRGVKARAAFGSRGSRAPVGRGRRGVDGGRRRRCPCGKAVAKASLPHFHWEQRPGSQTPRPQTTGSRPERSSRARRSTRSLGRRSSGLQLPGLRAPGTARRRARGVRPGPSQGSQAAGTYQAAQLSRASHTAVSCGGCAVEHAARARGQDCGEPEIAVASARARTERRNGRRTRRRASHRPRPWP